MTDRDIDRWTAAWREGSPPVADLASMARRERRWLLAWIALDWLVAAGLIGLAAWVWVNDSSPGMRFVAVAVVVLTLTSLAFTVRNWRGSLVGNRSSATDFLALSMHRSRARQRYIRFGWLLLAANLAVITIAFAMDYADLGRERLPGLVGFVCLVIAVSAGILGTWGHRERKRAERLAAMQAAILADGENSHE